MRSSRAIKIKGKGKPRGELIIMAINKFLINFGKGLLIFIFVVFVFVPFFNFWVERPLLAGTLILILYCILQWIGDRICYFKNRMKDKKTKIKR